MSERDCSHPVVVEFEKAETTSTSTNIRTTCSKSLALFVSSDSFLNAFSHILLVELGLTGPTSTSRSIRTTASSPLRYSGPVFRP